MRLSSIADKTRPDYLMRRIKALEDAVAKLQTARTLNAAASSDFDGDLDTATAGTTGWALGGALNLAIFNELVLRGGIIGDDALENPLSVATAQDGQSGFNITAGSFGTKATATLAVPDGFSRALVIGFGSVSATNGSASSDFFQVRVTVNGTSASVGSPTSTTVAPSAQTSASAFGAVDLTGLSGGSILVRVDAMALANTWGTGVLNAANIVALALFLR